MNIFIYIFPYIYTYVFVYTYICIYTYICTPTYMYMYVYMYTYKPDISMYVQIICTSAHLVHIYTYIYMISNIQISIIPHHPCAGHFHNSSQNFCISFVATNKTALIWHTSIQLNCPAQPFVCAQLFPGPRPSPFFSCSGWIARQKHLCCHEQFYHTSRGCIFMITAYVTIWATIQYERLDVHCYLHDVDAHRMWL